MAPHEHPSARAQTPDDRASLGGDVASQALNEALRVSFRLLKVAMVLVAVLFLSSGVFIVKEEERAFILRFGKLVRDKEGNAVIEPGLRFAWPFLIDEVVRFRVPRKLTLEVKDFWYKEQRTLEGQVPTASLEPGQGGYTVTGDANIIHSIWIVEYRVEEPDGPVKLFRRLAEPTEIAQLDTPDPTGTIPDLLRALLHSAVLYNVGTIHVDDIIGGGKRGALRDGVRRTLNRQLRDLDVGLTITALTLDRLVVPLQAQGAFDRVNSAVQEADKLIEEARADAERDIIKARGEASRIVSEAKDYESSVAKHAEADAKYMSSLLEKHPNDPATLSYFLQQRLIEVLQEAFAEADEIFIAEVHDDGSTQIRLHVERNPEALRENIRRRRKKREQRKKEAARERPAAETHP